MQDYIQIYLNIRVQMSFLANVDSPTEYPGCEKKMYRVQNLLYYATESNTCLFTHLLYEQSVLVLAHKFVTDTAHIQHPKYQLLTAGRTLSGIPVGVEVIGFKLAVVPTGVFMPGSHIDGFIGCSGCGLFGAL